MSKPVAFITGASRGIGAETAVCLAEAGFDLALTARTLSEGETHEYGSYESKAVALPGSLEQTAERARRFGAEVGLYRSDILDPDSVKQAAQQAMADFGSIDFLFNNACYQGPGNMQRLLDVEPEQAQKVFQGNVLTPMALVQQFLPGMIARGSGAIINMVSGSALNDPPAPADKGGWGFVYPASKAALIRMVPSLRVEHADSGLRFFNVEPGFVHTEVMKANGLDDEIAKRFKPTSPQTIAHLVRWLVCEEAALEHHHRTVLFGPQLAAKLGLASD